MYDRGFFFSYATTHLALQLHQERIQVVRSNSELQKRPAESNDTPAIHLGFEVIWHHTHNNQQNCFFLQDTRCDILQKKPILHE